MSQSRSQTGSRSLAAHSQVKRVTDLAAEHRRTRSPPLAAPKPKPVRPVSRGGVSTNRGVTASNPKQGYPAQSKKKNQYKTVTVISCYKLSEGHEAVVCPGSSEMAVTINLGVGIKYIEEWVISNGWSGGKKVFGNRACSFRIGASDASVLPTRYQGADGAPKSHTGRSLVESKAIKANGVLCVVCVLHPEELTDLEEASAMQEDVLVTKKRKVKKRKVSVSKAFPTASAAGARSQKDLLSIPNDAAPKSGDDDDFSLIPNPAPKSKSKSARPSRSAAKGVDEDDSSPLPNPAPKPKSKSKAARPSRPAAKGVSASMVASPRPMVKRHVDSIDSATFIDQPCKHFSITTFDLIVNRDTIELDERATTESLVRTPNAGVGGMRVVHVGMPKTGSGPPFVVKFLKSTVPTPVDPEAVGFVSKDYRIDPASAAAKDVILKDLRMQKYVEQQLDDFVSVVAEYDRQVDIEKMVGTAKRQSFTELFALASTVRMAASSFCELTPIDGDGQLMKAETFFGFKEDLINTEARGGFTKWLGNHSGGDNSGGRRAQEKTAPFIFANAFAHHSFHVSEGAHVCVDLQGSADGQIWTDPQLHSSDPGMRFGQGDLGIKGICGWLHSHNCNALCAALQLPTLPSPSEFRNSEEGGGSE